MDDSCPWLAAGFLALLIGAGPLAPPALAQVEPSRPSPKDVGLVEESRIALTLLDVNALDRQGRPLPGLKKEDFTLILNGRVRPIYSVDDLCPEATEEQAPGAATPGQPAAPLAAAIAQADSATHIALYIDFSQLKMSGRATVLDAAETWVRRTPRAGERVQLVAYTSALGLRVLVDFTEDRDVLLAAIAKAREDATLFDTFVEESETKILCCGGPSEAVLCPYLTRMCGDWAWEANNHAAAGMRALRIYLIGLETLPGRKALLYFQQDGAIFPSRRYGIDETLAGDIVSELDQVAAEANLSRTTIHTIQPSSPRGGDATNLAANLADFTGGSYNRAGDVDLEDFMRSVDREPRCVYRIGIVRPPSSDRILRATILVRDQPLEGRFRVRFLSAVDHWWRQAQAILVAPERVTDLRIATDMIPVSATRKRWTVQARVAVDVESVSLLPLGAEQSAKWEVGALLANARGAGVVEMLSVSQLQTDSAFRGQALVVHGRTIEDVKPGDYRLGAFARDRNINLFGGAEASLSLPDPGQRGLGGPVLMLADRPHLAAALPLLGEKNVQSTRAAAAAGPVPLMGPLRTAETIVAVTFICTGSKAPLDGKRLLRHLTRDQDVPFRFEEARPTRAGHCYRLEDRIEAGPLGPGDYAYHLSWSGASEADRVEVEASFEVGPKLDAAVGPVRQP